MHDDCTNQEPTTPLPGTLRGKVAFWIVGLIPVWLFATVILVAGVCGWK